MMPAPNADSSSLYSIQKDLNVVINTLTATVSTTVLTDTEGDYTYVRFGNAEIVKSDVAQVVIDYAADGSMVGIEIIL